MCWLIIKPKFKRLDPRWVAVLCTLLSSTSHAATTESAVKAGFIYNFTKFVEWPASAGVYAGFNICVIGDNRLEDSLQAIEGKQAHGKPIHLHMGVKPLNLKSCQIVFLAEDDSRKLRYILKALSNAPALTVSDSPGFVQLGGMIGLVRDEAHLAFEINLSSVKTAGLHVNAQLLKLAKNIKGLK